MKSLLKSIVTMLLALVIQLQYVETGSINALSTNAKLIVFGIFLIVWLIHFNRLTTFVTASLIKRGVPLYPTLATILVLCVYGLCYFIFVGIAWLLSLGFAITNVWLFGLILFWTDLTMVLVFNSEVFAESLKNVK